MSCELSCVNTWPSNQATTTTQNNVTCTPFLHYLQLYNSSAVKCVCVIAPDSFISLFVTKPPPTTTTPGPQQAATTLSKDTERSKWREIVVSFFRSTLIHQYCSFESLDCRDPRESQAGHTSLLGSLAARGATKLVAAGWQQSSHKATCCGCCIARHTHQGKAFRPSLISLPCHRLSLSDPGDRH
jgi:hypothetical protein